MPFNLGYELNLCALNADEREAVRQQVEQYKSLRPLVQTGRFLRLQSPFEGGSTAWMTVAQDGTEFAVWYYKPEMQPEEAYINVRLRGLEENARYRDRESGRVYSGAALMHLGLPIDWQPGDDFSQMWRFVKV